MVLRALALLSVLTLACGAPETRYVQPEGQDDGWLRDGAVTAWAEVGVQAPADYTLLFLDPAPLAKACNADVPKGATLHGCSFPGVVLLSSESDPASQLMQLTHEVGHLLRGGHDGENTPGHLDCPEAAGTRFYGHDVMCLTGAEPGTMPTARDAQFVRSARAL
jgi:hypothetical protein